MAKQRIHVSNLKIRLPRSAAGDARSIAESVCRELLKSLAGVGRGQRGNVQISEISVGCVKMSDTAGAQIGAKAAAEVGRRTKKGGRE